MIKRILSCYLTIMIIFSSFATSTVHAENYEVKKHSLTVNEVESFNNVTSIINDIDSITILSTNESSHTLSYNFLIPINEFYNFTEKINAIGKISHETTAQNNITNQIIQIETNIKNEVEHKNTIMEMIKHSNDLNAILNLEQHLIDVEINQTNNQNLLSELKSSVENIEVKLEVHKKNEQQVQTKTNITFFEKLSSNFSNSYKGTLLFIQQLIISISYLFVPLILIACICIIIYKVIKRGGKKDEEK